MQNVSRLSKNFSPKSYQVHLDVTHRSVVKGNLYLEGVLVAPSNTIRLHSSGLSIHNVRVNNLQCSFKAGTNNDELIISAKDKFTSSVVIEIEYTFTYSNSLNGLYKTDYKVGNVTKHILVSQCESHFAREIFPCIDEPEAKATFRTIITHDKSVTALSNTQLEQSTENSSSVTSSFMQTPLMSTYLFAVVVGDLKSKSTITRSGTRINCYSTNGKESQTKFSCTTAKKLIEMFEEYFGMPYPLTKCDLVAVPEFAAGAMENWGLITFRESLLLFDSRSSTLETKQAIAIVIAHELAHQWFGNLVTMKWWNDLWLNEGFACFMETYMTDRLFPEWKLWEQFTSGTRSRALSADALLHTHPIIMDIHDPTEITAGFDAISYEKSACLLVMLQYWLGDAAFKQGIRKYLKTYAYKNSESDDLWSCLSSDTKDVKKFIDTWVSKKGYPVVSVKRSRSGDTVLQQRRFSYRNSVDSTIWPTPIYGASVLFETKTTTMSIDSINIDPQSRGLFRVVYDKGHPIYSDLSQLSDVTRSALLLDAFECVKSDDNSLQNAIAFMLTLMPHFTQPMWEILAQELGHIRTIFETEKNQELFQRVYLKLSIHEKRRLGWSEKPNEVHADKLLRPLVLALSSYGRDKKTVNRCEQVFDRAASIDLIPSTTRGLILATVARTRNDKNTYDTLLSWHNIAPTDEVKHDVALALTSFKSESLNLKTLKFIKSKHVKQQDVIFWILYLLSNKSAKSLTWKWIQTEWQWIEEVLGGEVYFSSLPYFIARNFHTLEFLEEYLVFFEPHKQDPALKRSIAQGKETLLWQIDWSDRDKNQIEAALQLVIDLNES